MSDPGLAQARAYLKEAEQALGDAAASIDDTPLRESATLRALNGLHHALEVVIKVVDGGAAASRAGGNAPAPQGDIPFRFDFAVLTAMFDEAGRHKQYPKVLFKIEGGKVEIGRAGEKAKNPGTFNVTDGGRYPNNQWYGRINKDGSVTPGRDLDANVVALLERFAADPAKTIAEVGRESGSCALCGADLTDERSTAAGYGPVCAKNYGLPWG